MYIRLIFHTLDLFSSRLEDLGDMLVNQSRVKDNKNVLNVLPVIDDSHLRVWMSTFVHTLSRSHLDNFHTRVWMSTFVCTSSHSYLTKSLDKYPRRECKPGIVWSFFWCDAYFWQHSALKWIYFSIPVHWSLLWSYYILLSLLAPK